MLGVKNDSKRYFNMPKGEELERFQKQGFLPNPLPRYSIGSLDYIFGYSLWIVLGCVLLWYGGKWLSRRRERESVA